MRDAYGRKRSSRSIPTGPGSRGGWSHTSEYWRVWRAAHPEYRERDNRRRLLAKNIARLVRVLSETGPDADLIHIAARLAPADGPVSLENAA